MGGSVQFECVLILLQRLLVIASLVENQAKIVACRPFQFLIGHGRGNLYRLLQVLDGCGIIRALPVDQAELVMRFSNLVVISKFLFHVQSLFRELQGLVEILQFAMAVRDETQGDGLSLAIFVGLEYL
jgi:hypothetical protein